ncbi:hypothetical protein [Lutimonas sp.]|uniref:hypothetical protein n=1 Tax=Lutimonas sp. TaxID=1872403 RepID=UPI003C76B2D9
MKKNYVFYLFLFSFFIFFNGYSQTYKLDNGMVGRMPVTFNDGSFIKIQDSILLLNIHPTVSKPSVSEYKIVEDQVKKFEDREIRTLRLLSTSDANLRIHGTIVTGETVRNTVSANAYDMSTQVTTPYVMFIEK